MSSLWILEKQSYNYPFYTVVSLRILATLLERGRHAAHILLMGPGADGADGTVFLSKWKLKHDVPQSKVLPIGTGESPETTEDIKEAFNRLRFSEL